MVMRTEADMLRTLEGTYTVRELAAMVVGAGLATRDRGMERIEDGNQRYKHRLRGALQTLKRAGLAQRAGQATWVISGSRELPRRAVLVLLSGERGAVELVTVRLMSAGDAYDALMGYSSGQLGGQGEIVASRPSFGSRWTPDEKRRLRHMVGEGLSDAAIALAMGRSLGATRNYRRKLVGSPSAVLRQQRRSAIVTLVAAGQPDREIADELGMTCAAVQKVRQRARVTTAPVRRNWTSERVGEVTRLLERGASLADVERHLGLKANSVLRWLNRMGISASLSTKDRARAVRMVEMRRRGASDGQICDAMGWTVIPESLLSVGGVADRLYSGWTSAEDNYLREAAAAGVETPGLVEATGRSVAAVCNRRTWLGVEAAGFRQWTSDEDGRLRELFAAGADDEAIGGALDWPAASVRTRRFTLRLLRRERGAAWGAHDNEIVTSMTSAGATAAVIAAELGRSASAVHSQLRKLGLRTWRWNDVARDRLRAAASVGIPDAVIAHWLGRTVKAVAHQRNRMGLVVKVPWTPADDEKLRLGVLASRPDAELGVELGRTRKAIGHRQRLLDLRRRRPWTGEADHS